MAAVRPTLTDLKYCLMQKHYPLSSVKKKYLLNNAPSDFTYHQRVVLAYAQIKLSNNPDCRWTIFAQSQYGVTTEDVQKVNRLLLGD